MHTLLKATPERAVILGWPDGTTAQAWLTAKGDAKCQVAIQHRKLASQEDAERRKVFWADRLSALGRLLGPASSR